MPGLLAGIARRGLLVLVCAFASGLPGLALAQEAPVVAPPAVLVVDQDRLFANSAFGKASLERERQASSALEAENRTIQSELVAEEQALTLQRKTLSAEDFTARAEAFDQKVERIRSEQDAKARQLTQSREKDVKEFLAAAAPILGEILADRGAGVVLDKSGVILSVPSVDVTDEAIARIDAVLGDSIKNSPENSP